MPFEIIKPDSLSKRLDEIVSPLKVRDYNDLYRYLEYMGKNVQTVHDVKNIIEEYNKGPAERPILKVVSKRLLNEEICTIAVSKNGLNLEYVPDKYINYDMCMLAVSNNGEILRIVPDEYKNYEMCFTAVSHSNNDTALEFVPENILTGEKGRLLCETAVQVNGLSIKSVPIEYFTTDLVISSIENFKYEEYFICYVYFDCPLDYIPSCYITKDIVNLIMDKYPYLFKKLPRKFVKQKTCVELIEKNPLNLKYIPRGMITKKMVELAVSSEPDAILSAPPDKISYDLSLKALQQGVEIPYSMFSIESIIKYEKNIFPEFSNKEAIILHDSKTIPQNLTLTDNCKKQEHIIKVDNGDTLPIYYITDIHLEHQIEVVGKSLYEIKVQIHKKISEMISGANTDAILLIGGDVADSLYLSKLFYNILSKFWNGRVISVLGNHELWDLCNTNGNATVEEIIKTYQDEIKCNILENEIIINYKGLEYIPIPEKVILSCDIEELESIFKKSTFILLGGNGFTGKNNYYNASTGLYKSTLSREEDIVLSERFERIYNIILQCAADLPVIVLTHTPLWDWTKSAPNPNWIYVNGHNHQNGFIMDKTGVKIFSDNQLGYDPRTWHLNKFVIDLKIYDPFANLDNGVHKISKQQYIEFNRCQGIDMKTMKHKGDIYAIKYNGYYMFILKKGIGAYLLEGGKIRTLNYDIDYYLTNIPKYIDNVLKIMKPYMECLNSIAEEVKMIGGWGRIHGCIVDIDFYNHIYLNPFDGTITPYYATSEKEKYVYKNLEQLLLDTRNNYIFLNLKSMHSKFFELSNENKMTLLKTQDRNKNNIFTPPVLVSDTSIYDPSRKMRSFQYFFDNKVIRNWNDNILNFDASKFKLNLLNTQQFLRDYMTDEE